MRPVLSARELEVLRSLGLGFADKQIARQMGISKDTVKEYLRRVRWKYAERGRPAKSRVDLFRRSLEDGVSDNPGRPLEILRRGSGLDPRTAAGVGMETTRR